MNSLNKFYFSSGNDMSRSASDLFDTPLKNGRLEIGCEFKESKYAIAKCSDDTVTVIKDLQRLWSIKRPELVLSIAGGDENFSLPYQIRNGFKNSILKLAGFSNTCIITSGLNTGVSKLVGEAIANCHQNNNALLIGVSSFSSVYLADKMDKYAVSGVFNKKDCFRYEICKEGTNRDRKHNLDKNHTHFILIKNSSVPSLGDEIDFRVRLEESLCNQLSAEKSKLTSLFLY